MFQKNSIMLHYLALILTIEISVVLSQCQPGWIANPNGLSCYQTFDSLLSAMEAQIACFSTNSYLVTISDQTEFDYITNSVLPNVYASFGLQPIWVKFKIMFQK
jgi:hypothetical protein